MAISKDTKIDTYKLISPNIAKSAAAGAADKSSGVYQMKTIQAYNNLGACLNSIGGGVADIKKIELKRLADEKKRIKKFEPKYTKVEKPKFVSFVNEFVGRNAPNFLKGLLQVLSGFIKLAIIKPALEWLADKRNQKKIVNAIEAIYKAFKWISNFLQKRIGGIVDGLYNLLKEDATWWERLTGFARSFVNLAALFVGIRWLTNPLKLIKDVRFVLTSFYRSLTRFSKGLKSRGRFPGGWKGKALGATIAVGGTLWGANKIKQMGADDEDDEMEQGGYRPRPFKSLPGFATGGWISGPDSGYPVSTSPGGGSPEFIGHGTEYVAKKNTGESFVIPFNNSATRAMPGLTESNMMTASSLGFDMPRISDKQFFLGGLFKGAGNLLTGKTWGGGNRGTGRDGGFGLGTYGKGRPSDGGSSSSSSSGGIGSRIMQNLPQLGASIFGNKGGAIGSTIQTIFGGGGSGEGGKATFMDILKGGVNIAGQFMDPSSKAFGWMNTAGGIANQLFGPGTEGMSFGERLGAFGKDFLGKFAGNFANQVGGPLGGILQNVMGSADGGGAAQALGNVLGASQTGGGKGADQKLVGGGKQAVVEAGRGFLNQGYTVFNHPNFKNNRWRKGPPNRSGYDAAGRQRNGRGGLYKKGLAFDVAWFGKGNKDAQNQNVANMAYANRAGLKLTSIVGNNWGKWTFGGDKKAPGSFGVKNKIQMGFGDSQVAGSGAIGMSGSELERMKKVIIKQTGGDSDAMAVAARSIFNQAGNLSGKRSSSMSDILDSIGVDESGIYNPAMLNKAEKSLIGATNDTWLSGMITGKGFSDPQAMALMNSTKFGKSLYSSDSSASNVKFGSTVFSTEGNKFFNDYMKNTDLGVADGKNPFFPSRKETDTKKNQRGSAFAASKAPSTTQYSPSTTSASSGNTGTGSILGGPTNSGGQAKGGANQVQERKEAYALKKVYSDRSYAREQISERTRRLVAETMAAVEAHNSSVRANVAAATSAIENLKRGGGGMQGLAGSKASLSAANLQSNFNIAKF